MKKIILVVLLMIPFMVYAEESTCDKEKHKEYVNLSSSITYDNSYSLGSRSFTITIYNIFDGMSAKYNNSVYKPSKDNTIVISNIAGGTKVAIDIYGNDGCTAIKRIIVNESYYNKYYGSKKCEEYVGKLLMCSSQFTSMEVTESKLDKAIYNYTHNIDQTTTKEKVEEDNTLLTKVTLFLTKWGIKIVLAIISTIISISLFSDKYRKVKHGI